MSFYYTPYVFLYVLSAIVSAGLILYSWQRRAAPGGNAFMLFLSGVIVWSVGNALELVSVQLADKIFWANIEYIGAVILPVCWVMFALQYTGQHRQVRNWQVAILAVIPAITVVMAWTNAAHGFLRRNVTLDMGGAFSVVVKTYGPWFYVHLIYSYTLLAIGVAIMLKLFGTSSRFYRRQVLALLISAFAPWIVNAGYILKITLIPRLDLTAPSFTIMGLAIAWGFFRFRFMDVLPVAYDVVIRAMSDAVIVLNNTDQVMDLNPAAQKLFKQGAAEIIGKPLAEKLPIDLKPGALHTEITIAGRFYDLQSTPLADKQAGLGGRLIVLRDITDRRQMEKRLAQSEKLAGLGRFLSGTAHELNNPLTAIIGFSQLLLSRSKLEPKTREQVEIISREAERTNRLVQNLLAFAGHADLNRAGIDFNKLLDDTLQLREKDFAAAFIKIRKEQGELPIIKADYQQLQRALLNILINAEQAVQSNPGEKEIVIATKFDAATSPPQLEIVIADNGSGIATDNLSKIFDPFFTTRPVGKGMGLGLSISYGIIAEHDGNIRVESYTGEGAIFTINLPVESVSQSSSDEGFSKMMQIHIPSDNGSHPANAPV